jgi:hypothetical protein
MNATTGPTAAWTSRIPIVTLGLALSAFFALSFVLCVLGYLAVPQLPISHAALSIFLPGFQLGSLPSFLLGLLESVAWGWYIAVAFGLLYNFFAGGKLRTAGLPIQR